MRFNQKQWAKQERYNTKRVIFAAFFLTAFVGFAQAEPATSLSAQAWADEVVNQSQPPLSSAVINSWLNASTPTQTPNTVTSFQGDSSTPPVYIFISFSMPTVSLRQWLQQAQAVNGTVILRGLVQDSFASTKAAVENLLESYPPLQVGIQINPLLFRAFHIQVVPAVVIPERTPARCVDPQHCDSDAPPFDVVYGNTSLTSALETIALKGQVGNQIATQLLIKTREDTES